MMDFIFFQQKPFQLFMVFLWDQKIENQSVINDDQYVVSISEELEAELLTQVETEYQRLHAAGNTPDSEKL